jgi:hypothetical protein
MSMKNSNDTMGNRTRDPLAYSALPQATAMKLDGLKLHDTNRQQPG